MVKGEVTMSEKRTRKHFEPYNDYVDRGMMKWQTAFALGELTEAMSQSKEEATRALARLPQQTAEQIDWLLDQSIKYNRLLDIQLNTLDELGRVKLHVQGTFRGFKNWHTVIIGNETIDYDDIRHIRSVDFTKWSDVETEENPFETLEIDQEITDFCTNYYTDGDFIE